MSYISYKAGITLDGGFKLDSAQPLDVRFVVAAGEKKNDLLASSCYAGMEVWDANDNKKYRAIPSGTSFVWKEVGTKEDVPDIDLSEYIKGSGTINSIPIFSETQKIGNSIVSQTTVDSVVKLNVAGPTIIMGNDTGDQPSTLKILSPDAAGSGWKGRMIVGSKDKTFLMGTYAGICGIGAHKWTDSAAGSGANWEDVYFNPDGSAKLYLGGSGWTANSGVVRIENAIGGACINTGTWASPTWSKIATEDWVEAKGYLTDEDDTLQSVTDRGTTTTHGITLGSTAPLTFTGVGSETYTLGMMYCQPSGGIIFETPRASNNDSATILPFNIMTRGGQYAPLNSGTITSNSTVNAYGFVHSGLTAPEGKTKDDYVLLAGGSTKPLSEFAVSDIGNNYLPLSGGRMTGDITIEAGNGLVMEYTSNADHPWMVIKDNVTYGIRYKEGSPDTMRLSASGNASSDTTADLCINGNGDGTVTMRGKNIATQDWVNDQLDDIEIPDMSDYLPLSGGTMDADAIITLPIGGGKIRKKMKTDSNYNPTIEWWRGEAATSGAQYDAHIGWHSTGGDGKGAIVLSPTASVQTTDGTPWSTNLGLFISKTHLKYYGKNVVTEDKLVQITDLRSS